MALRLELLLDLPLSTGYMITHPIDLIVVKSRIDGVTWRTENPARFLVIVLGIGLTLEGVRHHTPDAFSMVRYGPEADITNTVEPLFVEFTLEH